MEVNRIIHGDALDVLRGLPDGTVDCVVTSPPYYGLRDYGTAEWEGGDPACDHKIPQGEHDPKRGTHDAVSSHTIRFNRTHCHKCGAVRIDKQIGLEATPAEYVARMVAVFAEVRRVLADDGTAWVNVGDSYATMGAKHTGRNDQGGASKSSRLGPNKNGLPNNARIEGSFINVASGLPEKSLLGIPWRLAFGLQDDGWILRSDIIWAKPAPMPESVRDRPTKAHEYVFLLSKSPRYWYDAEAIAEKLNYPNETRRPLGSKGAWALDGRKQGENGGGKPYATYPSTRNARTVWSINTEPTPFAHFATMPQKLVRRCILAGCKPGGVVLDPFFGSGTTGLVARSVGRKYVGIELNAEYVALAESRLSEMYTLPMFDRAASGED